MICESLAMCDPEQSLTTPRKAQGRNKIPVVRVRFNLNGRPAEASVAPSLSTLEMLRENFGLRGAKLVCGEGECGACTILLDGVSVNSCLMFAVDCESREVTTIEGLRNARGLDALQEAFIRHGAIQCGQCTPGLIMQAKHLLARNPRVDAKRIRRGIEGNLCRCTGYAKVAEAIAACRVKGRVSRGG